MTKKLLIASSLFAFVCVSGAVAKNWQPWSPPQNFNAISTPDINTAAVDGCASHSLDGLTIVFNSNRNGSQDLFMASRASPSDDFGPASPLPAPVNRPDTAEACPTMMPGKKLYFASDRDDPAYDLYVTRLGRNGWSPPTRLGPNINTSGMMEEAPTFYEENGHEIMIFTRRPPSGLTGQGGRLFMSVDGGPATPLEGGPSGSAGDNRASVTKDGLTIFWDSVRAGPVPDLYYATRESTAEDFGPAIHLAELSGPGFDARPYVSWDESFITFSSGRAENITPLPDIWFASRKKETGRSDRLRFREVPDRR